ncbi:MAG: AAA family ATPase, partial [Tannerella sp.]|nr:AAA family ATPase [Tannerella sp.]
DITLSEEYATICGVTQEELESNYSEYLSVAAGKLSRTRDALPDGIRKWYNGYSWNGKTSVYNPFSALLFFDEKAFKNRQSVQREHYGNVSSSICQIRNEGISSIVPDRLHFLAQPRTPACRIPIRQLAGNFQPATDIYTLLGINLRDKKQNANKNHRAICNAIFRRLPAFLPSAFCFLPTYHKTMPREV